MRDLSKSYHLRLSVALLIIFIISENCGHVGSRKVVRSRAAIYTEFSYYPNGKKEYAAEYLNGKLDGISRHWTEDGFLISKSEFSHGKPHGIWKRYHINENTLYEAHYFHGQKHGEEKWYYENGQIKSEQSFHYGEPSSTIIRWHPNGSIIY